MDHLNKGVSILEEMISLLDVSAGDKQKPENANAPALGLNMPEDAAWLKKQTEQLNRNAFTLVVTGSYNNGKSTLINALNGKEILPVGAIPTTALITRLVRGERHQAKVLYRTGEEDFLDWGEFVQNFQLNTSASKVEVDAIKASELDAISCLDIQVPEPLIAQGIEIIDTPGLSEHQQRTRLVLDFLPDAHGVIVVIDAMQALKRDEREFIKLLGAAPLEHVYFVVNRVDLIPPGQFEIIKQHVISGLRPCFMTADGSLDDKLMQQRLFFVNAHLALEAKVNGETQGDSYEQSGFEPFEKSLNTFLSIEFRQKSNLRSLAHNLIDIRYRAEQKLRFTESVMQQPKEELNKRQRQFKGHIMDMKKASAHVFQRFDDFSAVLQEQIYFSLINYVDEMQRSWPHDVEELEFSELENLNIFAVKLSQKEKDRFVEILSSELRRYLDIKFIQWAQKLSGVVGPAMEGLVLDIRQDLEKLQFEMDEFISNLAGKGSDTDGISKGISSLQNSIIQRLIQSETLQKDLVKSLTNGLIGNMDGLLRNDRLLGDIGSSALIALVAVGGALLGGGLVPGFIAIFGRDLIYSIRMRKEKKIMHREMMEEASADRALSGIGKTKVSKFKAAVRHSLAQDLHTKLFNQIKDEIVAQRTLIFSQIEKEFLKIGRNIQVKMDESIARTEGILDEVIGQREEEQRVRAERLSQLKRDIDIFSKKFDAYTELAFGRVFSPEEILELGDARETYRKQYAAEGTKGEEETPVASSPISLEESTRQLEAAELELFGRVVTQRMQATIRQTLGLPAASQTYMSPEDAKLPSAKLGSLIGLKTVKQSVLDLMDHHAEVLRRRESGYGSGASQSLHMVFSGNPGTGKTTVAEIIGEIYREIGLLKKGHVVSAKRSNLVAEYVGQTAPRTRAVIEAALDGVLFIDEAYSLVTQKGTAHDFGAEAIQELLQGMEQYRGRLVVIVAGYPAEMEGFLNTNPGLRGRFPEANRIHFPNYFAEELFQILKKILGEEDHFLSVEATQEIKDVIAGISIHADADPQFSNARVMRNFVESMVRNRAKRVRQEERLANEPIQPSDIADNWYAYKRMIREDHLSRLDKLIGLDPVKKKVRTLMAFHENEERRRREGIVEQSRPSLHMVFSGNPGTGKTTVAEIIGGIYRQIGLLKRGHVVPVSRANLVAGYVGQTAQLVRQQAKKALGGVLFIDEAYSLTQQKGGQDFGQEVVEELLQVMEEHRDELVVVVAGYPKKMETFLNANPGLRSRFSANNKIDFPDFNIEELAQVLENMIADQQYELSEEAKEKVNLVIRGIHRKDSGDEKFGNAREMRNLRDSLIIERASRIKRENLPFDAPIEAEDINEHYAAYLELIPKNKHKESLQEKKNKVKTVGRNKEQASADPKKEKSTSGSAVSFEGEKESLQKNIYKHLGTGDIVARDKVIFNNTYTLGKGKLERELTVIPSKKDKDHIQRPVTIENLQRQLSIADMVLLYGINGSGKTDTAMLFLDRFKEDYGHVAWLSCAGSIKLTFLENERLLQSLNFSVREEADENQRFDTLLGEIGELGNKVLIVLDNLGLRHQEEIRSIHFPANVKILATSANQLEGFQEVPLPPLGFEDAKRLFAALSGKKSQDIADEALRNLFERVGYHTFTIESLARALRSRRDLDFTGLLRSVQEKGLSISEGASQDLQRLQVLEGISRLFDFDGLTPEEKSVMRYFSVLPSFSLSFKEHDLPLIFGIESETLGNILSLLINKGFLEEDAVNQGVKCHQILQELSRSRLGVDPESFEPMIQSFGKGLIESIDPEDYKSLSAMTSKFLPLLDSFIYFVDDNTSQFAPLYRNLGIFYRTLGDFAKSQTWLKKEIETLPSDTQQYPIEYGKALGNYGLTLTLKGNYNEAKEVLERALKHCQSFSDHTDELIGFIHYNLGNIYISTGELYKAQASLQQAKASLDLIDNTPSAKKAAISADLGSILENLGEPEAGMEQLEEARIFFESSEKHRHSPQAGLTYLNLSNSYLKVNRFEKAKRFLDNAEQIFRDLDDEDSFIFATIYNSKALHMINSSLMEGIAFADIDIDQEILNETFLQQNRAIEILRKYREENHPDFATPYLNLARLHLLNDDKQLAVEWYHRSLNTLQQNKDNAFRLSIFYFLSITVFEGLFSVEERITYLRKAIEVMPAKDEYRRELATIQMNLGGLLYDDESYNQALTHYYKSYDIFREVFEEDELIHAYCLICIGSSERCLYKLDKALDHLQQSKEIAEELMHEDSEGLALLYTELSLTYSAREQYAKALLYKQKAIRVAGENFDTSPLDPIGQLILAKLPKIQGKSIYVYGVLPYRLTDELIREHDLEPARLDIIEKFDSLEAALDRELAFERKYGNSIKMIR